MIIYEPACCCLSDHQEASLLLSDSPLLTLNDLLSFSFQVSQAMDFLSSRNVRCLINTSVTHACRYATVSFSVSTVNFSVSRYLNKDVHVLSCCVFIHLPCSTVCPQRPGSEERPGLWGEACEDLRLWAGQRSDEGPGLHRQRKCKISRSLLTKVVFITRLTKKKLWIPSLISISFFWQMF